MSKPVSASLSEARDEAPELIAQLQGSVADFCRRALRIERLRALREASLPFDRNAWLAMAELGWTSLIVAEERGGLGLGADAVAVLCRQLGRVVAAEPLIESAITAATVLAGLDRDDRRLSMLISGEMLFTCPVSSAAWGNLAAIDARAMGDAYILQGQIDHLPAAPDADAFLLPVRLNHGLAVFHVRCDAPGVEIITQPLADGSHDGRVKLSAVRCAETDRLTKLDEPSLCIAQALVLTGVGASAYLLGLSEALFERTLEYLRTRRQFGRVLGSFQALQHRLVDLYLKIQLSEAALNAAVTISESTSVDSLAVASARARLRSCDMAQNVIREAIQMHGAIGYTEQCDVSLYVQRALVMLARYGGAQAELNMLPDLALGQTITPEQAPAAECNAVPVDGDWNSVSDAAFRMSVRHWIEANYPADLRHFPGQVRWQEIRAWHQRLLARGWAAPAWPREHGGMGLTASKMLIFIEELERWGVARAPDQGIVMVGPILFEYGSDAQRAQFLGPALRGEHIWCQGYSEPNAGSDLASLTTRAVLDGDEFIVNGQKTWTSHALDATHMYCLVRTDAGAKPQAGISFLLIDLGQSGVTIRPIRNLGGHVDFCEVFLDDVRVPRANLVGRLNEGWTIAKSLLGHERLFVGSPKLCQHALHQLRELALATGLSRDPVFMNALARITLDVLDLEALYAGFAAIIKRDGTPGADVAILKIWSTETYVRLSEMIVESAGPAGAVEGKAQFGDAQIDVLGHYYSARPAPIYAGSNEIQRNIIAKHVLNLPS